MQPIDSQILTKRFLNVRKESIRICEPLEKEDFVVQPSLEVSPPKWHLAHTTWFFETFLLVPYFEGYTLFDQQYPYLFNSYYVQAGPRWERARRGNLTRPSVDDILKYQEHVDRAMAQWLNQKEVSEDQKRVLELGLHHEQQHQELLYYDIKYIFGHNPTFPKYGNAIVPHQAPVSFWITIKKGTYEIGYEGPCFHFDNEEGRHQVFLHEYEIASHLTSNKDYLKFIEAGGYQNPALWLSEGWDWVTQNEITAPLYWLHEEGEWSHYTLNGYRLVDWDQPVSHISYYEADAFARWSGCRLPTEQEWEVAARRLEPEMALSSNFTDKRLFEPVYTGGHDFHGNLWEWTASAYLPYPFYKAPDGALGEYNGKFMINQMVLRGGSYATARDHIRTTYRNFFHPHFRWMFSGIRLARHTRKPGP